MPSLRPLVFCLLPLFSACQLLPDWFEQSEPGQQRLQGEVQLKDGQLLMQPCNLQKTYLLEGPQSTELARQVETLREGRSGPAFIDLRGILDPIRQADGTQRLEVTQLYRLQFEGHGCSDRNFKRLVMRASGHEPEWNINIGRHGLLLERVGEPALALPYMEEQLPNGSYYISTEANELTLQLWLIPTACTDSMSGTRQHLQAQLSLNGQKFSGCAAYGALRGQ